MAWLTLLMVLAVILMIIVGTSQVKVEPQSAPFVYKTLSLNNESIQLTSEGSIRLTRTIEGLTIGSVKITDERSTFVHIAFDYEFYPLSDDAPPRVGAKMLTNGMNDGAFAFKPATLKVGRHTAVIELSLNKDFPFETYTTDTIELFFWGSSGSTFYTLSYNFVKTWCKPTVGLINAYLNCPKPSATPETNLFLSAEALAPAAKPLFKAGIDGQPPVIATRNVTTGAPVEQESLLRLNGNFDSGLQNWTIENGIVYTAHGGLDNTGGLRMQAKPFYPTSANTWRSIKASTCLSAKNVDAITVSSSIKLLDTPKYARAHTLELIWYATGDCSGGGQYGGQAYIEKKLGWQTLQLANKKAKLNAQSFAVNLVQNQTYGQKRGTIELDHIIENRASIKDFPIPVVAVWDNISIDYQYRKDETASLSPMATRNPGLNLLHNPTFTKTSSGWRTSTGTTWKPEAAGRSGILETSIKTEKGSRGAGAFSQCINLEQDSGILFEAGLEFHNVPGTTEGKGLLRFSWYSESDCKGRHAGSPKHHDIAHQLSGWIPIAIYDIPRPDNTASVLFDVTHSVLKPGAHEVWWDNAYFKAVK